MTWHHPALFFTSFAMVWGVRAASGTPSALGSDGPVAPADRCADLPAPDRERLDRAQARTRAARDEVLALQRLTASLLGEPEPPTQDPDDVLALVGRALAAVDHPDLSFEAVDCTQYPCAVVARIADGGRSGVTRAILDALHDDPALEGRVASAAQAPLGDGAYAVVISVFDTPPSDLAHTRATFRMVALGKALQAPR